jgi:L-lactate dehydrogenase
MSKKISIVGVGNVGASIAFGLAVSGKIPEILLLDINKEKADGEALDIQQGTPFAHPVIVRSGDYSDVAGSDIIIYAAGIARKVGQTRLDLAQTNIDIMKKVAPEIIKYAPDALYVVVSNPVDILTYALIKNYSLSEKQVIGTGTILDTSRLRSALAAHVAMSPKNIHAYVFGEHGDSLFIPWSLTSIGGLEMSRYCTYICDRHNQCGKLDLQEIEKVVRTSGATVISKKGATYYAIAMSVMQIIDCIYQDMDTMITVSGMINNRYGVSDVCLSLPFVIGRKGIQREVSPPMLPEEIEKLQNSANILKNFIAQLDI